MSRNIYLILCALAATSFSHATHYPRAAGKISRTITHWECPADTAPAGGPAAGAMRRNAANRELSSIILKMHQHPEETKKSLDALQNLINNGADVNAPNIINQTPLIEAIGYAISPEAIRLLIKNGADILIKDSDGRLPIEHVERRMKDYQAQLEALYKQKNPDFKEQVSTLRTRIENLQIIAQFVNPAQVPAAPSAPTPAAPTAGSGSAASSSSSSSSSPSSSSTMDLTTDNPEASADVASVQPSKRRRLEQGSAASSPSLTQEFSLMSLSNLPKKRKQPFASSASVSSALSSSSSSAAASAPETAGSGVEAMEEGE